MTHHGTSECLCQCLGTSESQLNCSSSAQSSESGLITVTHQGWTFKAVACITIIFEFSLVWLVNRLWRLATPVALTLQDAATSVGPTTSLAVRGGTDLVARARAIVQSTGVTMNGTCSLRTARSLLRTSFPTWGPLWASGLSEATELRWASPAPLCT